jgi:hypothetical protein
MTIPSERCWTYGATLTQNRRILNSPANMRILDLELYLEIGMVYKKLVVAASEANGPGGIDRLPNIR